MCLITFQSTRQSATPLSGSHHPENYSFILEQLELPVYTAIFPVFPPLVPSSSRRLQRFSIPCLHLPSIVGDFDALRSLFSFFSSPTPFLFLSSFTSLVSFLSGGGENPGREVQSSLALVKGIVNIYPVIVTGGRHKRGGMSLRGEEIWFSSSEIDKGI